MASGFVQESESAVFGSIKKKGSLVVSKGGKIRVSYDDGLLLVADGTHLVQYDPDARTAQRFDLRLARREAPILGLLLDPGALGEHFEVLPSGATGVRLKPRKPNLPVVELEGKGAVPTLLRWTDSTGARQLLRLTGPPGKLPADPFRFDAPPGTRWIGAAPKP